MKSDSQSLRLLTAASRFWVLVLLLLLSLVNPPDAARAEEVPKEYQIKAAFLYNFTKFVTWPTPRPGRSEPVFIIGVLGRSPFGKELETISLGRKIGGRPLQVRLLNSADEARAVDLLFVASGEEKHLAETLDSLHAASVLTVGESSRFAAMGGIITFSLKEDKVRFEINRDAGLRARLKISPQLLKLALSARPGKP